VEEEEMRHLPSIEALSDVDDRRLLAELEVCRLLDKLSRANALVERAKLLLTTIVEPPRSVESALEGSFEGLGAKSGPAGGENTLDYQGRH
jgi:hypothetical protein